MKPSPPSQVSTAARRWCLLALVLIGTCAAGRAQTADFRVLHTFGTAPDAVDAESALLPGMDGNLYGTTQYGGTNGSGTVYELAPDGVIDILHSFSEVNGGMNDDGANLLSALVEDGDGNLYGTTPFGGKYLNGTVFEITADGTFVNLHNFSFFKSGLVNDDGAHPVSGLLLASDGTLYGTASYGGTKAFGTVFKIAPGGTFSTVCSFDYTVAEVTAPLVEGRDGNLYGVSPDGANGTGLIFQVTPGGIVTPVHNFRPIDNNTSSNTGNGVNSDGSAPTAGLILGSDGNLYGTASEGGAHTTGTVFQCTAAGVFTVLYTFGPIDDNKTNPDGAKPTSSLVLGSDGNFYGTTSTGGINSIGTIFALTPSGTITTLHSFAGYQGEFFHSSLTEGNDGTFYGTTGEDQSHRAAEAYVISLSPTVTSPATATANVGSPFTYQITAIHSPASFSVAGLKGGLRFNAATGVISGTPTAAGTITLTVRATNSAGTGTRVVTITVGGPLPVITSAATATGTAGSAFSYQIMATNSPTRYGVLGLPAGLTVNANTGQITGTPTKVAVVTLTLKATNANGATTKTLVLTINAPAGVITSDTTASATVGQAFGYQITATYDPTSFGAAGLPPGLTVNTRTGVISGTPTTPGTFKGSIAATNASGTGRAVLTITVTALAPVVTSAASATATVGAAFSYQITASNVPTRFGVLGLLPGLSVNTATGVVSGTPTKAGTFNLTLRALNSGGTGEKNLTLTVAPAK